MCYNKRKLRSCMENIGLLFIVVSALLFVLINFKRFFSQKSAAESFKKEIQTNPSLDELQKKNEAIIKNIEGFLKTSRFYEMAGRRGDDKIYNYILNSGKIYKFDGFLSPNNLKVGVDEDFLFFKGMSYKRITDNKDTKEFYDKFPIQSVQVSQITQPSQTASIAS